MSIRSLSPSRRRPLVETLEERCLLAALYLAPDSAPFALVGRAFSLDIEGYGPDPGSDGPYTYTHPASVNGLAFAASGNVLTLSGTPAAAGTFHFTVGVDDQNSNHGDRTYKLEVCPPAVPGINLCISDTGAALAAATAGSPYSQVLHAAGGNGQYTYAHPPNVNGLTFSPYGDTLTIFGTPTEAGSFPFTITTTDTAGNAGLQSFTLAVGLGLAPGLLPFPGMTIAPGLVGLPYNQTITVQGGTGPLTFTNPPTVNGLSLTAQGDALVLQGMPAAAGTFPFTVSARDSANHATSFSYTLNVAATPVTLNVLTPDGGQTTSATSLAPAQVGKAYSQQFQAQGGSGGDYFFNFPTAAVNGLTLTLPNGSNTLTLSGMPTHEGTFGYILTVVDGYGITSQVQQFILDVGPASSALKLEANGGLDLPAGTQGTFYTQTLTAFGGPGAHHFSTEPVTRLPTGLSFTQSGPHYVLSGTPTEAGSFPVVVKVESGSESATHSYIVTIEPSEPLTLTRQFLPPAMQGFGYIQNLISNAASAPAGPNLEWTYVPYQLTAAGGSGADYSYTASGLPSGMTFSATGEVGGTPTVTGDFPVVVTVTDSAGNTAQKTYTLAVTSSLPFVGNPFNEFLGVAYRAEQAKKAYGFDKIILSGGIIGDGRGQTIAVIEESDQPTMVSSIPGLTLDRPDQVSYADSDLARFNAANGLPQFGTEVGPDAPVFVKLNHLGGTEYPIATEANGEFAGDVMTIHALAPRANIIVFVAPPWPPHFTARERDAQLALIYQTMMSFPHNLPHLPHETKELLKHLPPVSVVSSSVYYQYNEDVGELNQEHFYVPPFPDQPATVVIAAGDTGYFPPNMTGPQYPGNSANVISAAMTQPTIGADGRWIGELGVSSAGGGPSLYLPQPSWQNGVVDAFSTTKRVGPDVGMIGSFNSGMSFLLDGGWNQADGSSNAAPAWAALLAIMNQGRELLGQKPLNGITETLPLLYGLPASDFHKISQLDNGTDVPGNFNINAGLGSPVANSLVPGMLGGHDTIKGRVLDGTTGLAGWTVFLDANDDGVYQVGREGGTTTGAGGDYSFLVSPGDNYRVRVQPPVGTLLRQTSANPGPLRFAPGSDQTAAGVDFLFAVPTPPTPVVNPPVLKQVLVNGGRRGTRVGRLTLIFAGTVSVLPKAFRVIAIRPRPRLVPIRHHVRYVDGNTEVTLRFLTDLPQGVLPRGLYKLRVRGDQIRDVLGRPLDEDRVVRFFSL